MPTIFEQINSTLSGNALTSQLAAQAGKISGASNQLTGLIHGQFPSLTTFAGALGSLTPPNLTIPSNFSKSFSSLGAAVPTDLSSLTGGVTTALQGLDANVSTNIVAQIQQIVGSIQALQDLLQKGFAPLTLPGAGAPSSGAGRSGGAGTGSGPAGGGVSGKSGGSAGAAGSAGSSGPSRSGGTGTSGGSAGGGSVAGSATQTAVTAAQQSRLNAINQANTLLTALPAFDAPSFLTFVHNAIKNATESLPRQSIQIRKLPVIDDVVDMLSTAIGVRAMDAAALSAYIHDTTEQLAAFLTGNGSKPLSDLIAALTILASQLDTNTLNTQAAALTTHLANIGAAVATGNISGVDADVASANAALDVLLPIVVSLNSKLFNGQVDAATRLFELLPVDTERHVRRVLQGIHPVDQVKIFQTIGDRLNAGVQALGPDNLAKDVDHLLGPVINALNIVNIIPIREPVLTAIDAIHTASDGIDRLLAQVAAQSGLLFSQVDQLLGQIDVSQVTQGIQQAISDFQSTLQQKVSDLFAPVQSAISDGVTQISNAVSGFKPDDIIAALRDVIKKLTDLLQSADIQNAITTISQAIQTASAQIQSISITPVTGQVVSGIDDVTNILKSIDVNSLSLTVKIALKGAVAVLPGDLKPVTNPLQQEFDKLVDAGPKPLLVQIEAQPAKLLNQIKSFSPANLIGDQLDKPFQDLIGKMEQFKPSSLLAPVEQALNGLKDQLRKKADPGQLLKPLEDLFNQVLAQFDKLKPQDLVKPLNDIVQGAINKVLSALPVAAVLQTLNDILARIKSVSDIATGVKTTLEKAVALFAGLANPEAQLQAWMQPLFDHIGQISDVSSLQPSFDKVSAAVNGLKAGSMRAALNAALSPLQKGISNLNPAAVLASVAAAYGSIHADAVAALPVSSQKTSVQALLARFNPVSADFSRPFEGLQRWLTDLKKHRAAFETLLVHWDLRFHGANGPFADFLHPSITADDLKTILHAAVDGEIIQPLGHLLGVVGTIAVSAQPVLAKVTAVIDTFEEKVQDLLLGPGALGGIVDAVNGMIQRLKNINFNFLVTQLDTTFQAVKSKLQAVSPTAIRTLVEHAFNNALNLLDVHQLLPRAAISDLDKTYQKIIDDLKAFDPKTLIIDVVEPEFQSTITPLLQPFDLTALMKAIIDKLDGLKGELGTELDKVNQHYKAMLQAVPSISLADAAGAVVGAISGALSGDVGSIGGSLGF